LASTKVLAILVLLVVLLGGTSVFLALRPQGNGVTSTLSSSSGSSSRVLAAKGVSFSPSPSNNLGDFFTKAQQSGSIVEWAGDWDELSGGAAAVVDQLAVQHGLKAMVIAQVFAQSTGALLRPLNSTNELH
jgi:hypothetical protein